MIAFDLEPSDRESFQREVPAKILIRAAEMAEKRRYIDMLFAEKVTAEGRLGMALRKFRLHRNFSIEEMAERSQCPAETIIALEAGILSPEEIGSLLPKIMLGLEVSLEVLAERLEGTIK